MQARWLSKKWRILAILILLLAICSVVLPLLLVKQQKKHAINIYGALPQGVYAKTGQQLQSYLQKKFRNRYKFVYHYSDGSVENIRELQAGKAQIALVQEDVAYYFHRGGHSILKVAHRQNNKVNSLVFLFWEYLLILATPDKQNLQQLQTIDIGSLDGGSRVTAINLRDQLQYPWKFETTGEPLTALATQKVDAIFLLTANKASVLKKLQQQNIAFRPLSLSKIEIASITASFPFYQNFSSLKIADSDDKKHAINTVATRALLAVHNKLPADVVRAILHVFIDPETYVNFTRHCTEIQNMQVMENGVRFSRFPLPMHPLVFELQWKKSSNIPFWLFLGGLSALALLLIYVRYNDHYRSLLGNRRLFGIRLRDIFETFWRYLLILLGVALYMLIAVHVIKYLEVQAFIDNKIEKPSPFVDMEFQQLCTWVTVFTVTGYEDEIFPYTELGKILASTIRIVALGGIMFILGRISADYLKTLLKGPKMEKGYNLKKHIVICDWNEKGEKIVNEVHSPLLKEHGMARPIIVIAENGIKFPDTDAFEDTFCIPGDPISGWKLSNANVQDAYAVIILAAPNKENTDTHTILVAMEIAEILDKFAAQVPNYKRPHITAELIDHANCRYLVRAGVDEVISGNDLGVKLLAQSAVTPGITAFMEDILKYSADSNELYIVAPPEELLAKKACFLQISNYLLQNRIENHFALLVGIQKHGNPPYMLVNPEESQFPNLEPGDKLVVMARKRPIFV